MFESETYVRVRYAETDRMGYVYYGNYSEYYEVGRVEALRQLGMSYREMEDSGIMLPVLSFSIKYYKPAYYDDLLRVKTIIAELPKTRIKFIYQIYNANNVLLNEGETTLVFVKIQTGKPCMAPEAFLQKLNPFFK
ncbi:MAG: acyl-CoA thioesterase [Bacteroidia bacterium]|nr:acyl-CoA thioesterase [Bacteroidia bacterium]MCZ2248500.1 acyl-CoA thioesterase [Bacteroidia bacterium]